MKQILPIAFLLALLLAVFGCSSGEDQMQESPAEGDATPQEDMAEVNDTARLNNWLDKEFATYLDFSPLAKTRLGDKSDYDKLDDVSEAMDDRRLAWRRRSVASMKAQFDRNKLTGQGKVSFDLWVYMLERAEEGSKFRRHRFVFGRRGPHTGLPNGLINYHKVESLPDIVAYISRLNQSGRYLLQYLEKAKISASDGIRAPYFDYEIAASQIERLITGEPFGGDGVSALWTDISGKISGLRESGEITDQQSRDLMNASRMAMRKHLKPAYDEILAWLRADIFNSSEEAEGAWALPDGRAYYDYRLSYMTTLPLTSDEIHDTGLSEVARIQAEMEGIKTQVAFEGTLVEFFDYTRTDDQFFFPNTDQGRADYLALADEYLEVMKQKLPEYFGILPKADLDVRRVEAFREQAGAAAHYMRGTRDGSRPGVFYVHLADMRAMTNFRLEDLAYHEGLPGHHMQISIQQELDNIPRFRTYHGYTAFSEGWGLYAEYLGKDMGFYGDAFSDFGRLSGEIWRAVRLVVDTGIHAKKWTEQQAIEYALQNSPRPEASVRSEIRRYFNNPGQATAYKIGMLKILELRAKAMSELGDEFDIRGFHDAVLGSGPLPLPLLESRIDAWIGSQLP